MIIKGAESFLLKGGEEGVLLIHGFTGNPAEMLMLGEYLRDRGYTVHGVRLAGHATDERDLVRMAKEDWIYSVMDGYEVLSGLCDKVSVVGASMGGLLAMKLTLLKEVDRLITLAAPIFIDESKGADLLPPRDKSVGLFVRKPRRQIENVPAAVNRTYQIMPLMSVHELIDLIGEVKGELGKITAPILILHGTEDHTARVDSAEYIYEHVSSDEKEMKLVEGAGHLLPVKEECRLHVFELVDDFLKR